MDFYDYYDYGLDYGLAGLFGAAAGVFIIILLVVLALVLVLYILRSIGLMTLARNRGIPNPWLAWIPIAGDFTLGAIVDDINERESGSTPFRFILLGGSILNVLLNWFLSDSMSSLGGLLGLAMYVLYVVCLNKIFKCYRPHSATSWTVLCAIPFTAFMQSIFPFVMRNDQPAWNQQPPYGGYPGGGYNAPPPGEPWQGYPGAQGQQPPQGNWQQPPQGNWQQPPQEPSQDRPYSDPTGSGMFQEPERSPFEEDGQ